MNTNVSMMTMNTDVSMTSMKGVAVLLARLDRLERLDRLKHLDELERFVGNAALSSNSGLELR